MNTVFMICTHTITFRYMHWFITAVPIHLNCAVSHCCIFCFAFSFGLTSYAAVIGWSAKKYNIYHTKFWHFFSRKLSFCIINYYFLSHTHIILPEYRSLHWSDALSSIWQLPLPSGSLLPYKSFYVHPESAHTAPSVYFSCLCARFLSEIFQAHFCTPAT